MQYTRGEPKDFNGLGGKKSLAAEWDRWIADREGGGSMRTARELSQRRRGLRHFGANGLIRSRGRRVLSAVSLRELQLRRTARNRAWLIAMAMVSTLAGSAQAQEDASKPNAATSCTAPLGSEQADILLRLWTYGATRCSISILGTARRRSPTR